MLAIAASLAKPDFVSPKKPSIFKSLQHLQQQKTHIIKAITREMYNLKTIKTGLLTNTLGSRLRVGGRGSQNFNVVYFAKYQ
jgi:hypothetical protein